MQREALSIVRSISMKKSRSIETVTQSATIPTPWRQRLQQIRLQVLPVVVVSAAAWASWWLWPQQTFDYVVGEVATHNFQITCHVNGQLIELPTGPIGLFKEVRAGQIIAQLDDIPALTDLAVVQAQHDQLQAQLTATEAKLRAQRKEVDHIDTHVAPIQAMLATNQARQNELQRHIDSLQIRTPVSGFVSAIQRRPGQAVLAGDQIMTLAVTHPRSIVTYIRNSEPIRPKLGMPVQVCLRKSPKEQFSSHVERIGPEMVPVPDRQLRNPAIPEWGLPVLVAIPDGLTLRPSELVELRFKSAPDRETDT